MKQSTFILLIISLILVFNIAKGQPSYYEESGQVVMEAENFYSSEPSNNGRIPEKVLDISASGGHALYFKEFGQNFNNYSKAPKFNYPINFSSSGIFYVWVRSRIYTNGWEGAHDEFYVALDGANAIKSSNKTEGYGWKNVGFFNVEATGNHQINLAFKDDGQWIDKIILTTDFNYQPEDEGPVADALLWDEAKSISYFGFKDIDYPVDGVIDEDNGTIDVTVANGTDITNLTPTIIAPYGATVSPESGVTQDFTNPVTYTVTALDETTKEYEVSVNELLNPSSDKNITRFYLDKLQQEAEIDNDAGTITIDYYKGYNRDQQVTIETSLFASISPVSGSSLDIGEDVTYTLTAQDGSVKDYTIVWNEIEGVRSFADDYSTDTHIWPSTDRYIFTWDATNLEQDLKMESDNTWFSSEFEFPETLNLAGVENIRIRMSGNTPINQNGIAFWLTDSSGFKSQTILSALDVPQQVYELKLDFSDKLQFSEDPQNQVDITQITKITMRINKSANSCYSSLTMDDFRVGEAAEPNQAPTIDNIQKPAWIEVSDGAQNVDITGISDGDPDKDQSLSVTVTSSDESVVTAEVLDFDPANGTATVQYSPVGIRGFAEISVKVTDSGGAVYSDETDTAVVKFLAEIRDPSVNNPPSFSTPSNASINPVTGQNVILISNVTDGDDDKTQSLSFTVSSDDEQIVRIDSIKYQTPHHIALLYVSEFGNEGTANITLEVQDDGGTDGDGADFYSATFPVNVSVIVDQPGVYYEAFNYDFWRDMPYRQDPGVYYETILPSTVAKSVVTDKEFFWMRMKGYIIPKVTGDYIFSTEDHEGSYLYLSTDYSPDNLPPQDEPTAYKTGNNEDYPSDPIHLEAGKIYYFEAYDREVVLGYNFRVDWSGPGFPTMAIESEYVKAGLDIVLPSKPGNAAIVKNGVNDVTLKWDKASDDALLSGYNIYIDGIKNNDEPVKNLEYKATGLRANTEYTITVRAVDEYGNKSHPSDLITFTTYEEDNQVPSIPDGLVQADATGMAIKLAWNPSTDNTEIRGYNIYFQGETEPINESPIRDTSYFVIELDEETGYNFVVTAIDAAYNESGPSDAVAATTTKFCPTCPQDGLKKARAKFELEPIAIEQGMGVNVGYHGGMVCSNKVKNSYFESPALAASPADLEAAKKEIKNASFALATGDDAYAGEQSAELTVSSGSWFRNISNFHVDPGTTYLLKFAMKRDANYEASVGIEVWYQFTATIAELSVTPTEEWVEYTLEFTPTFNGANQTWWIDFKFNDLGTVSIDNVELHIKEFYDGTAFTTIGKEYLEEMQVSGVRWGGVEANHFSLKANSGPYFWENSLTFADMVALSNQLGGYTYLCTGTGAETDFYTNPDTHADLIEYLAGPTTSEWGAKRAAEGYDDLMSDANGIIIEFGNEVWGRTHGAAEELTSNQQYYGEWCNDMAEIIKNSPYYDAEKIFTSYAGGAPDGFRVPMVDIPLMKADGEKGGKVDFLSQSGYLSAGFVSAPDVEFGESALEYHKNTYKTFQTKQKGLLDHYPDMLKYSGRTLPFYFYEGNNSPTVYHGNLGNAITFTDWYATCKYLGAAATVLFHFDGGNWKLVDATDDYKKLPQFYTTKLYNSYCKGEILKSSVESENQIYDSDGIALELDPIGMHAFTNDGKYTVALFSRDFENNYYVQVDLPNELTGVDATGTITTLTGESYESKEVTITEENVDFMDSLIVNVPKYSMVIVNFQADDQNFTDIPLSYPNFKRVESIELDYVDDKTEITEDRGMAYFEVNVMPEDAVTANDVVFTIIDPHGLEPYLHTSAHYIRAVNPGEGTVTMKASALEDPEVYGTLDFTINVTSIEEVKQMPDLNLYPNPVDNVLNIDFAGKELKQIAITDLNGRIVKVQQVDNNQGTIQLNVENLNAGIYHIQFSGLGYICVAKFVKR